MKKVYIVSDDHDCIDKASLLIEPAFTLCVLRSPEKIDVIGPDTACVILDESISGEHTIALISDLTSRVRDVPLVVCLERNDVATAVRYTQRGATDCIVKPVDTVAFSAVLARTFLVSSRVASRDETSLVAESGIVGSDTATVSLRRTVARVAQATSTVLIHGESGVGKEIVAQAIHRLSKRSDRPIVAVNCSAIPDTLFESELFGVERGAFTGALSRPGLFAAADGGTLFLDEIGDLRSENQAKLLRALEEKRVTPLGSTRTRSFDVRIVCATHRNLLERVRAGRFRKDLYYRISAAHVSILPLRSRPGDIEDLVEHFYLSRQRPAPNVSPGARDKLLSHSWPGNVRELFNVLERRDILSTGDRIAACELEFDPV